MIIIFSGPSGVGKSTIINELIKYKNLYFSVSHTTREKRHNEKEGEVQKEGKGIKKGRKKIRSKKLKTS